MSASPNLMAMFNQLAQTARGGAGGTSFGSLLGDGLTPGSLLSPSLWPDTTRSAGTTNLLRSLTDDGLNLNLSGRDGVGRDVRRLSSLSGGQDLFLLKDELQWDQMRQRRISELLDARIKRSSLLGGLDSTGPVGMGSGLSNIQNNGSSMCKGVQFDKERNKYQVSDVFD